MPQTAAFDGAIGLQATLYNPDLDGDGAGGRGLAGTPIKALGSPDRA